MSNPISALTRTHSRVRPVGRWRCPICDRLVACVEFETAPALVCLRCLNAIDAYRNQE